MDYPWVGETYSLGGKHYSVVEINHPDNPTKTKWSAYRNYGRFGAFPVASIAAGQSATFKYRFVIADGPMFSADLIQKLANEYTGRQNPTPTTAVLPAEVAKPATQPTPKPAKQPTRPLPRNNVSPAPL